jgi:hypothetical protein
MLIHVSRQALDMMEQVIADEPRRLLSPGGLAHLFPSITHRWPGTHRWPTARPRKARAPTGTRVVQTGPAIPGRHCHTVYFSRGDAMVMRMALAPGEGG